jgi:hypothetical protein
MTKRGGRLRRSPSERDARREGHGLPLQVRALRPRLDSDEAAASLRRLQEPVLGPQAEGRPSTESSEEVMSDKELIAELLACLKEAVASMQDADQTASDAELEDGDPLADWKAAIRKAEQHGGE